MSSRAAALALALLIFAPASQGFASSSAAEEALARPTLVGMQLSVRKAAAQGKVTEAVVACVNDLSPKSFVPIFTSLLKEQLSADEIVAAENFFASGVGQKFIANGIAQLYVAAGEQPPEPATEASQAEYAQLKQFSGTSAGNKLMVQNVLETESARKAITAKVQELLNSCRSQP